MKQAHWGAKVYAPSQHREFSDETRLRVALRDGNHCQVRGCKATRSLELHHIWPVSQGGKDDEDNLITLCYKHHDEIEDNGMIHSRSGIVAWGTAVTPTPTMKKFNAEPDNWQSWVYGGAVNPNK